MSLLLLASLLFQLNSWFAPLSQPGTCGGFQFSNYRRAYVTMPKGLEQAVEGLGLYEQTRMSVAGVDLTGNKPVSVDSLLSNAGNTGLLDAFCAPYAPAANLNATGEPFERVKVYLVGKIPCSANYSTTVAVVEYDVRSYCDYRLVMLLLNTKGRRILSVARVGMLDFGSSRIGYSKLDQGRTFRYEDSPESGDVSLLREGLRVFREEGEETDVKPGDCRDYINHLINYATFRIDGEGYIDVMEKGRLY